MFKNYVILICGDFWLKKSQKNKDKYLLINNL